MTHRTQRDETQGFVVQIRSFKTNRQHTGGGFFVRARPSLEKEVPFFPFSSMSLHVFVTALCNIFHVALAWHHILSLTYLCNAKFPGYLIERCVDRQIDLGKTKKKKNKLELIFSLMGSSMARLVVQPWRLALGSRLANDMNSIKHAYAETPTVVRSQEL